MLRVQAHPDGRATSRSTAVVQVAPPVRPSRGFQLSAICD